jgi:CRISPR-associated protein Cas2
MQVLHEKVKKKVKPEEDNIRFYWITKDAASKTLTIGSDLPQPPPKYYVI